MTDPCANCPWQKDNKKQPMSALGSLYHLMTAAQPRSVYLAARYSKFPEMQRVARDLADVGYSVTSRWIQGKHKITNPGLSALAKHKERARFAEEDIHDLLAAEIVICFTEQPRSTTSRGGRHVEFGVALAMQKKIIVIGPMENVFYCMPSIESYPHYSAFKEAYNIPGVKTEATNA